MPDENRDAGVLPQNPWRACISIKFFKKFWAIFKNEVQALSKGQNIEILRGSEEDREKTEENRDFKVFYFPM